MDINWQALSKNVFLISADRSKSILYAPLQGLIMEVNQAYLDRFRQALGGNADAGRAVGLAPEILEQLIQTPPAAERRLNPQWPEAFEPTSVTVFLSHQCTLRCAYCYCRGGEGGDMPRPVFERAIRFTLEHARRQQRDFHLSFHGGDVGACWPFFQECVAFIKRVCGEAGVKPVLSLGTNGFYTEEQADYIATHINNATVSIDGIPAVHDRYRVAVGGRPSLAETLRSTRIFEAKGMAYSVRMTVTRDSLPLLPECVEHICRNTHAGTIRAEPLYSRGRAASSKLETPDPGAFVAAFREARRVAQDHRRILSYSGARLSGVYSSFCSYPAPTFGVTPEGHLTCCYEVLHPGDPLRNPFFYGHIPLDGSRVVVDAERVAAIRAWAKQRREACAHCFCVFACAGDCAAKVMDGASPAGEVPKRCHITRALVSDMLNAVLSGKNPLQQAPPGGGDGLPRAACACVDCSKTIATQDGIHAATPPPGRGP